MHDRLTELVVLLPDIIAKLSVVKADLLLQLLDTDVSDILHSNAHAAALCLRSAPACVAYPFACCPQSTCHRCCPGTCTAAAISPCFCANADGGAATDRPGGGAAWGGPVTAHCTVPGDPAGAHRSARQEQARISQVGTLSTVQGHMASTRGLYIMHGNCSAPVQGIISPALVIHSHRNALWGAAGAAGRRGSGASWCRALKHAVTCTPFYYSPPGVCRGACELLVKG